jgi:hypothetical protein
MPNTRSIPVVLYDETNSLAMDADFSRSDTSIRRALHDNNSVSLLNATREVLGA